MIPKCHKVESTKHLIALGRAINRYVLEQDTQEYKLWFTNELLVWMQRNGISIATPRGEGVAPGALPLNGNQSTPQRNFLQCPDRGYAIDIDSLDKGVSVSDVIPVASPMPTATCSPEGVVGESQSCGDLQAYQRNLGAGGGKGDIIDPGAKEGASQAMPVMEPEAQSVPEAPPIPDPIPESKPEAIAEPVWPKEADVAVVGPALNPRLYHGTLVLPGGRVGPKVTLWRGRGVYRAGAILPCRLDVVQGGDARYLPIGR